MKKLFYPLTLLFFVSFVMISQTRSDRVCSNYSAVQDVTGLQLIKQELPGKEKAITRTRSEGFMYSVAENPSNPANAYSNNKVTSGQRVYMGFEFEASEIINFIGSKISHVNIATGSASGQNKVRDITVFMTKNLGEQPFYVQEAQLGEAQYTLYPIELKTPYEIVDDTPLYIGYYFKYETGMGYYIPVDGKTTSKPGFLFTYNDGNSWPARTQWSNDATQIGSLCMSVTIQGDNLPENTAKIDNVSFPRTVKFGEEELKYEVEIVNSGVNSITSVEIQTNIDGSIYTNEINTNEIPSGSKTKISVEGVPFKEQGIFEVTSTLSKVNGVENENVQKNASGIVACYKDGYPRNMVLEEGTGTWCGYCPAGIVMCEYIHEKYNDRLIPIAVHSGDRMEISEYKPFIYQFISGYPSVVANRTETFHPANLWKVDNLYQQALDNPAYAQVKLNYTIDGRTLNISTETEFSLDTDMEHQLSFVVVEDGVGPYIQENYYGPGSGMGMWDTAGSEVSILFDDVARQIDSYPGISNSLPSTIQAGEKYSFKRQMNISRVVSDNFRVIAMITNTRTGEIINATQTTLASKDQITLDKETLIMSPGETVKLNANIISEDSGEKKASWSSSNNEVATVDEEGNVTAVSAGTAIVTAAYGDLSARCLVTVEAKEINPTGIVVYPNSSIMEKGATLQLNFTVEPEGASYSRVVWSSSDETVATVDDNGLVSALNAGTATITVTVADNAEIFAGCEITVTDSSAVNSVSTDGALVRCVNGTLEISGFNVGSEFTVYDISGSKIFSGHSADSVTRVELAKGVYLVRIGCSTVKIII